MAEKKPVTIKKISVAAVCICLAFCIICPAVIAVIHGVVMGRYDYDKYSSDRYLVYDDVNWENEDEVNDIFSDEGIKTCDEYFENEWYETFSDSYTTSNGEKVVAFGYYGHD